MNKVVTTGRDGTYFFARLDGTVHPILHDGTGRYIVFSTMGGDGTFLLTARDGTHIFSLHRRAQWKNTLLSEPVTNVIYTCTGMTNHNEARPRERNDRGRLLPSGKKASS